MQDYHHDGMDKIVGLDDMHMFKFKFDYHTTSSQDGKCKNVAQQAI